MRSLIILTILFFLASCLPSRPEPPIAWASPLSLTTPPKIATPITPEPNKDGKIDHLEQAKHDLQVYTEGLAQAKSRVEFLEKQAADEKKQARAEALQSQVLWITVLCLLFAAICGVAAFVIPIGKKMLVAGAVGFTTVAICAQAFESILPYLPWIGGVLVIIASLWALLNGHKLGNIAKNATDHGDRLEAWLQDLPEEARLQADKIVEEVKVESQKQAEALGIHNQLQYLRGKAPSLWQRITNQIGSQHE